MAVLILCAWKKLLACVHLTVDKYEEEHVSNMNAEWV